MTGYDWEAAAQRLANAIDDSRSLAEVFGDQTAFGRLFIAAEVALELVAENKRLRDAIETALEIHPRGFPTPPRCTCSVCSILRDALAGL